MHLDLCLVISDMVGQIFSSTHSRFYMQHGQSNSEEQNQHDSIMLPYLSEELCIGKFDLIGIRTYTYKIAIHHRSDQTYRMDWSWPTSRLVN